ncbi:hypothetical protein [Sphingomonas dokdonensis]|uniref:Uncharacterized protein n=1 Tax=Sphingomonas dokdonensis TaxID=344880 RepID=A0A245ZTV4_9SPHN|nr:hypothetical protein [Sphingomonas dokdonensis]OWK33172.1 hypothetical protein SPDO_00460 [Sphingomonas dokdonensis]
MPSSGWDWTDFQEHALKAQRATLRDSLSQVDAEELFEGFSKQLEDLQDENRRLKEEINRQATVAITITQPDISNVGFLGSVAKEIYPGEIIDRVRLAVYTAIFAAETSGVDERSLAIWEEIVQHTPRSPALDELLSDLSRATKDPKRVANEVTSLLERHGYRAKSDNKHVRLEPQNGYVGLKSLTVSKTPSDSRGLKNLCKQIERTLGISKLPAD